MQILVSGVLNTLEYTSHISNVILFPTKIYPCEIHEVLVFLIFLINLIFCYLNLIDIVISLTQLRNVLSLLCFVLTIGFNFD